MKKIIIALLPLLFLLVNGCNSNDTATGTNPFGGGGGTGNVTIQIAIGQDDQGANVFAFNPSVAIKLTSALVVQAQLGINETVNNPNPDQVFNAGEYIGFYSAPIRRRLVSNGHLPFQVLLLRVDKPLLCR